MERRVFLQARVRFSSPRRSPPDVSRNGFGRFYRNAGLTRRVAVWGSAEQLDRVASKRVPTLASASRQECHAARDTPARSSRSQKFLWVLAFYDSPNHSPRSHFIPEPDPDINQIPRCHKDQKKD
jgi:hypothetical protein